jgi:hypothetical protein
MLENLQKLIRESNSIPESQKAVFLETIKHLSDEELERLEGILMKEKGDFEEIEKKHQSASSITNKKHIEEINSLLKTEKKKEISRESLEEKANSEKVLDQLNDL